MRTLWVRRVLLLAVTIILLALIVRLVGSQALLAGGGAVNPLTIAAALALGFVGTGAQAIRFSLLLRDAGTPVTKRRALADCYGAGLLNMVLPGGLGGDMARVVSYRDAGSRRWLSGIGIVGAERLSATTLLLGAAALALVAVEPVLAWIALVLAAVTATLSALGMRGLPAREVLLVWATAAMTVGSFFGLYLIAMLALGGPVIPALAVIGLAAMSIPVGVGGWGVREVGVAVVAAGLGGSVEWAVTSSTGYGLLAMISTLPGVLTLLFRGRARFAAGKSASTQSQHDR